MEMRYDSAADALYIRLSTAEVASSEEVDDGVVVDYDSRGNVVGIEILGVRSRKIDLNKIIEEPTSILPVAVG
ncbi:MAG: DUF2283 domain-containing protein [Candidatus Diapherotrites archaeon]|nr:DUF2283 domain-containing protein [Candidatus Diapherotrites archaeon]